MRDDALISAAACDDHSIRTRRATRVEIPVAQDGEFVVWGWVWEAETLVVVVLMWV